MLLVAVAASLAALGGAGVQLEPASAAVTPVEMTSVCVTGGQGQLSFPIGGTCSGKPSFPVDNPAQILATCYLNSNGAIRKVTAATQCSNAPRSKKETFLLVPSLMSDQYFCANTSGGALYFRGTSPVTCPSGQFLVVVKQANHPPVSNAQSVSVNEDGSVAITLAASDAEDQSLAFSIVTAPLHGALGAVGAVNCAPVNNCTATVTYTPSANYFGPDSFTFRTNDGFANSADATVSITVHPVNDVPSFTKGLDKTFDEDSGPRTISPWATAISAGPANESGQTVSFVVTNNSNPGLFSSSPSVSPTGVLSFTSASNQNGTATITLRITDDGGTANGGVDQSATQSFTITIDSVNDVPSFTKGADQTVLEDAGAQTVTPWATAISAGPADESGQSVSFTVTNDTPLLFSVAPAVASNGTLTYTPAPNANGEATITLKTVDNGAPPAESATQTFKITVTSVNDAPGFTKGADQAVDEDSGIAGTHVVTGWATAISAGPNESGQTLTFNVTGNTNPALFTGAGLPFVDPATRTLSYTTAPDANGVATITLTLSDNGGFANGGVDTSAAQTFTITVAAVNDAPGFTKGADQTVDEDAGAQSVALWATAISAGPNESGQTVSFNVTGNTNAGLFSVAPAVSSAGTLTFTPAADANGEATITLEAVDDGSPPAESAEQTFKITVTPVNDAPSFVKGADQSVLENAGAQTVTPWATGVNAGPNESGQTLTFNVTGNTNTALFSAGPAVSSSGTLTYTPAAGTTGEATITLTLQDNGGTASGGVDTSAPQSFKITVSPPNATPVAQSQTGGSAVAATEDTLETITLTATDADDDNLTFSIVGTGPSDGALGAIGVVDCTTTLNTCTATVDYTPDPDYNGADSFTFKANDGTIDSNTATIDIVVDPVNDAPGFTKGADQTVDEDAGAQTVTPWATAISAGPADESGQTVSFSVTGNTNAGLFSVAPAVSPAGVLTYTPAANQNGTATITLTLQDDGGTANGGVDTSAAQTFTITVAAVNDAPGFTKGADQTVDEDAGAQSVALWATAISAGPNESGQTVSFNVTGNTNAGLFSVAPAVSSAGTLTFTPAANQNGTATITLTLQDNGGTASGGVDTSAAQTFDITITAVNDLPVAQDKPATAQTAIQTNMKRVGVDASLLTGITDADSGVNGCSPTFSVASITSGTGGTVSNVNLAAGTFDFEPTAGFTGTATVSYTVSDDGCPGVATSAPATVSLTVSGPVIWFVNPAAGTNGTGTLASPFNVLASADAVDAANHRVFVYSGTTTTGLTLNLGEWLIGQGATGSFDSLFAITPPAGTITRPTMGTGTTTIGSTVTLASNTKAQGVAISSGASTGLNDPAAGIIGVSVSEVSVTTTTGTGVDLSNIVGTLSFTGLTTSGGTGANLAGSNSGSTFGFAGISVSSGANAAFAATGGGTVTVTGSANTLATTTGTALNVANTTIGASGLTFRSIAANGGANGIVLNNTGSSGGLTVTGNGGTCTDANTSGCSGGTIQNTIGGDDSGVTPAGTGIVLNSTAGVSLTRMYVHDHSNYGIRGTSVNGFTLDSSVVGGVNGTNVASPFGDGSVSFDNLSGTSAITNSAISGGYQRNIRVDNTTGTLTATFNNNSIHNTGAAFGDDGLFVEVGGGTANLNVTNNTFAAHGGDHFNLSLLGSPVVDLNFTGNFWSGGHAIGLGQGLFILAASFNGPGSFTYDILNNGTVANPLVGNNSGGAIHVNKGSGTGTFSGTISNNVIGDPAVNSSGSLNASGIDVEAHGSAGSHTTVISNNLVRQFHNDGILILAGEGSAALNATVTGNTVTNPDASLASLHGMHFNIGTLPADNAQACLDVRNNSLTAAGNEPNAGVDLRMRQRQLTTVRLPGYAGASNDSAAVQTFLTVTNANMLTTSLASNSVAGGGGGFVGGAACAQP